jgi:hypothetical protein
MNKDNRVLWFLAGCAALAVTTLACTLEAAPQNPPADSPGPGGAASGPASGQGEIVVAGDLDLRYTPADPLINSISGTLVIALVDSDGASGVAIFIPADIQPGTYPIGDLFHMADASVTARYDHLADDDSRYYESTSGTLVLTETGTSFAGSFSFTAVRTPAGASTVTVDGSFGPLPAP